MKLFRRFLPRGLFARALLILVVPTVLVQCVALYIFFERHWESVSRNMAVTLAGEVATIVSQMDALSTLDRSHLLSASSEYMNIAVSFEEGGILPVNTRTRSRYPYFEKILRQQLAYPFQIMDSRDGNSVILRIGTKDGVLRVVASSKKLENPTTYIFVFWLVGSAILFLVVSLVFLRNQVRPITRLAEAAQRFGRGMELPDFKPSGAREIRQAATAFLSMSRRIKRQVQQRTEMLAGISHDLRTPLTRLKLQLAMMPASREIEDLQADVQEMEQMVQGYLEFARGEGGEALQQVDLAAVIEEVAQGVRRGGQIVVWQPSEPLVLQARSKALRRSITNVVENALRYGTHVSITLHRLPEYACIQVEDDGPGIALEERENVFRPFYRLEKSRNKQTGGVGLGLAIARDAIVSHGGDILLSEASIGGLKVEILLPLAE